MTITSPCSGICKIDISSGWCLGCGRTSEEMDGWGEQSEEWRQRVWEKIPQRLNQMGVLCRRLPWTTEDIRKFIISSLETRKGTWVLGVVGAVGEFIAAPGKKTFLNCESETILAHTKNGAMQLKVNDDVRALTFGQSDPSQSSVILLGVKQKSRKMLPIANEITYLGEDANSLLGSEEKKLFDLGLGRNEAKFCVRVKSNTAYEVLKKTIGLSFTEALPLIAETLMKESPVRVIETAIGRVEVQGKIPHPEASSPAGPHTHLLPNELETGRSVPIGMEIPSSYLPGAIFYPAK